MDLDSSSALICQNLWFSDDDPRNIEKMGEFLSSEYEECPVNLYLAKGGEKKRF